MKRSVLWLVGALLVLMFQNCSQNVDFKTQPESLSLGSNTGDGAGVPTEPSNSPERTEQFKVAFNSEAAPLDMMWVIDNSASMDAEAALVRKNFDAFLTALNMSTNFRLVLITTEDLTKNGVTIPSSFNSDTHLQINHEVGSFNGPSVLLKKMNLAPNGFLRSDSKKIIVFVTDDNSDLGADSFLSSLVSNQKWSKDDISVSSFIGLNKADSPCMAREGAVYKTLASDTKGKNYNICDPDWSAAFSNLIEGSVSKAVRRFTLTSASEVKEILEVKVDGKKILSSLYSVAGKTVTLADSVALAENSQVTILFK